MLYKWASVPFLEADVDVFPRDPRDPGLHCLARCIWKRFQGFQGQGFTKINDRLRDLPCFCWPFCHSIPLQGAEFYIWILKQRHFFCARNPRCRIFHSLECGIWITKTKINFIPKFRKKVNGDNGEQRPLTAVKARQQGKLLVVKHQVCLSREDFQSIKYCHYVSSLFSVWFFWVFYFSIHKLLGTNWYDTWRPWRCLCVLREDEVASMPQLNVHPLDLSK